MTATAAPRPRWPRRCSQSTAGLIASARNSATRIHVTTVRATHTTSNTAAAARSTPSTVMTVRGRRETMRSGVTGSVLLRRAVGENALGAFAPTPDGLGGRSAGRNLVAGRLGLLLQVVLGVLRVLLARLLDGLAGGLGGFLRRLLAVLDRDLGGLLGLLLERVGHRADLLVFDARGRDEHAGQEADGQRADR